MPPPAHVALIALLASVAPAAGQELEPEQAGMLQLAREAALGYTDSLPDFICTQVVRRSHDPQGNGRWRALDTLTVKLTYFDRREDYKLMLVNGKPTGLDYLKVGGAVSSGEFGTRLYSVFDPKSRGEYHWGGWTTLRKRRVARFSYRIARENSIFRIVWGKDVEGPDAIVVATHGEVWVDEETHMTLRLTQVAEIPAGFPIQANEASVDYDFASVGGKMYLLPSQALVKTRGGTYHAENYVTFREYRKFQTETNITFDAPAEKK